MSDDELKEWAQRTILSVGSDHHEAVLRLFAERDRLAAVLQRIQETCEHDINQGIVPDNCIVWQIEADARASLADSK